MHSLVRRYLSHFTDIVYPPRCPFCDSFVESRHTPCSSCAEMLTPLPADANVSLSRAVRLSRVRSCFAYESVARDLVRSLKYSGRLYVLGYVVRSLALELEGLGDFDAIVSVPADLSRMISRGVDSAALLAKGLSRSSGFPFRRDWLARSKSVPPQVGLAREERERNVRGAFHVEGRRKDEVKGFRILVVDDVMTTGATLNDCARALALVGASEVCGLTFARAL